MFASYPVKLSAIILAVLALAVGGCGEGAGGGSSSSAGDGSGGGSVVRDDVNIPDPPPDGGFNSDDDSSGGGATGGGDGGVGGGDGDGSGGGSTPSETVNLEVATPNDASATTRAQTTFAIDSSTRGLANLSLFLGNVTSFQTVSAAEGRIATLELRNPSGTLVASANDNPPKSFGTLAGVDLNVLPYPALGSDEAVVRGTYVQKLTLKNPGEISGTLIGKRDPDTETGTLRANVFLVGATIQEAGNRSAVYAAVDRWAEIYGATGITVVERYFDVQSDDSVVPNPYDGSSFYSTHTAAAGIQWPAVNVFVGLSIASVDDAAGDGFNVLGISGGIPGAAIPTPFSAVAVSFNAFAGSDGAVNAIEARLMGETFAHEAGHYLGLFHPVNINTANPDSAYVTGDPLSDTPTCANQAACIANGLITNLMYPVYTGITQEDVTAQQSTVLNLQVLVD